MKIIVISDTHGNVRAIEEIAKKHPDAYLILHLGDGINDIKRADRNGLGFVAVKGNCDGYSCDEEESFFFKAGGKKIFMTHGHKYKVKSAKDLLLAEALKLGADICLFGHTHIKHDNTIMGVNMINPGSLGYDKSYVILNIEENISMEFETN